MNLTKVETLEAIDKNHFESNTQDWPSVDGRSEIGEIK